MGHFLPPAIAVRDGSGLPDPLLVLGTRAGEAGRPRPSFHSWRRCTQLLVELHRAVLHPRLSRRGSELRAEEIRAVVAAAQLGERPFVIGHSFGGFMTMKVASQYGDTLGGAVIVDSPIRSPEEEARHPLIRPPMRNKRVYETFDAALARFRLMPEQPCDNPFIVEFIGRYSLKRAEDGWVWKFDSEAMGSRRFGEPVREYLQAVGCRAALIFGEKSALVSRETASYMNVYGSPHQGAPG